MPTNSGWVQAEVFMQHNDVTVYHAYKDDDMNNGRLQYGFTVSYTDDEAGHFDVRELETPSRPLLGQTPTTMSADMAAEQRQQLAKQWDEWHTKEPSIIAAIIREAIELNLLPECDE